MFTVTALGEQLGIGDDDAAPVVGFDGGGPGLNVFHRAFEALVLNLVANAKGPLLLELLAFSVRMAHG